MANNITPEPSSKGGTIISSNGHNYSSADTITYFANTAEGKDYYSRFNEWYKQHIKEDPSDWTTPYVQGYDLADVQQRETIKKRLECRAAKEVFNTRLNDFIKDFPVTGYITWYSEPYDD